jgi:hypothetical protein
MHDQFFLLFDDDNYRETKRSNKRERERERAGDTRHFYPLYTALSYSITAIFTYRLTKYPSHHRKERKDGMEHAHFISRLLKSSMALLSPRKLLHLHSVLLGSPRLQLKQRLASLFTGFMGSSWHGGLMQRSRLRSGHLSGFPCPQSPPWFCGSWQENAATFGSSRRNTAALSSLAAASNEMVTLEACSLIGRWVTGSIPRLSSFLLMCVFQ